MDARVHDARFDGNEVSISVWVDGWGEVVAREPDLRLLPASNQKLLTAMGALDVLGPDARFVTSLFATTPAVGGVVNGDLVLVGGGDPTLHRTGQHSLEAIARVVRQRGITEVRGGVRVDESHFDGRREADGWLDWHRPTYAGALSALMVDGNQYRSDGAFLADPALFGGEHLQRLLAAEGVAVVGPVAYGTAPIDGVEVVTLESAPVSRLVETMLMRSDNMIAESLVKQIDAARGGEGSTAGGLRAIRSALEDRCIPVAGIDADGSGLSRANARSASEWRRLLVAARDAPWAGPLATALPLAGRSGTLVGRLTGEATAGNVRAKTGSIIPGRALSGYLTTAGGRPAAFSVVVNGSRAGPAQAAIDALVTVVAAARG
jgi:D-alanyl-D-alanine carboxypeptidase/D-alanyl-D-alanine-endopeptidase (penicillin-binding protein 4)